MVQLALRMISHPRFKHAYGGPQIAKKQETAFHPCRCKPISAPHANPGYAALPRRFGADEECHSLHSRDARVSTAPQWCFSRQWARSFAQGPSRAGLPVEDCPCDGTNDERGGGSFDHEEIVDQIDRIDGEYAMYAMLKNPRAAALVLLLWCRCWCSDGALLGSTAGANEG